MKLKFIQHSLRNVLLFCFTICLFCLTHFAYGQKKTPQREYIEIRVYHAMDSMQIASVDRYLQRSLLPALEKGGFGRAGFYKAIDNDTARDKRMYAIIALNSLAQIETLSSLLDKTVGDTVTVPGYMNASYNAPPYIRFETILLRAFEGAPQVKASGLTGGMNERVYELRSYESATEALHQNKVKMFNSGEIDLFQRLGFNAVFYGQVIAGSQMPNLMYMTSFENKAARDEHWKTFGSDPEWKTMSAKPEYQHNVSKNTSIFLRPTSYSKL